VTKHEDTRLLCIVLPCFNEEQVIEQTYRELTHVLADLPGVRTLLYFVDDGSTDSTLYKLNALARRDPQVRVISLSRNFGHQAAITAGLDLADRRADAWLVMDADLENPPALIPRMLDELERGHDVVMGVRETGRRAPMWNRLASRGFYWTFNKLSEVPIEPSAPDFFLLSRRAREALLSLNERSRFLRGMVAWIGFSRTHVPYVPAPRAAGSSKYTLSRMWRLACDAIFAFSSTPLRLVMRMGMLLSSLGFVGFVLGVLSTWFHTPAGAVWFLASLGLLLSGVQLSGTALVGGYVARAFDEAKRRPLYLVKQAPDDVMRAVQPLPLRDVSRHA
jgi:dolichol-phosphate mannosyltransferase